MAGLPAATLRRCLDFSVELLPVADFLAVAERLLPGLADLLHSEVVAYHRVDRRQAEEVALGWPETVYNPESLAGYPEVMACHPIIDFALDHENVTDPLRTSDLVTRRQWRANPVYRESYRLLGIDDQMVLESTERGGCFSGVSVGRSGRDYADTERDVLALVAPHVTAALRRAEAADREVPALRVAPTLGQATVGGGAAASDIARDPRLTRREAQVLGLAAGGLTDRQIARRLDVTTRTVSKHLEHAYPKLGVNNRQAAARALQTAGPGAT